MIEKVKIEDIKIGNDDPIKRLQEITKKLIKSKAGDDKASNELLDVLSSIKELKVPDKSASSWMELVEDYLIVNWQIRFNLISNEFEYYDLDSERWEKLNENEIYRNLKKLGYKISMADLLALLKSNFTPKFNPFRDYFESLPAWDGKDHISALSEYLEVGDQKQRFINMLTKWMVRSIACAFGEIFNKQAIVIIGGQNNGKSSFLRWLCPPKLRNYYKEDLATDKDSKIALSTNFIINIDELSTLQKKDINAIKSLMSTETLKERIPYDRSASVMRRHASFLASTDRGEFLSDEAGSVRWICFLVERINWDYSTKIKPDKLWAQANHLYSLGKSEYDYQLTREEIEENENYNKQFYVKGAEHEAIMYCFERTNKDDKEAKFITATEAIQIIRDNTRFHTSRMTSIGLGKAFRLLNFDHGTKYENEKKFSIKGYYVRFTDAVEYSTLNQNKDKNGMPF